MPPAPDHAGRGAAGHKRSVSKQHVQNPESGNRRDAAGDGGKPFSLIDENAYDAGKCRQRNARDYCQPSKDGDGTASAELADRDHHKRRDGNGQKSGRYLPEDHAMPPVRSPAEHSRRADSIGSRGTGVKGRWGNDEKWYRPVVISINPCFDRANIRLSG